MGVFKRARATFTPEHDLQDRLREALRLEWEQVGARREALVAPLLETLTQDENLLTIELAAEALATQGEDGLTALIPLLGHDDFAIRSKAVIGIGLLDRSARWAVRVLSRALDTEQVWLVNADIVRALGRLGGQDAERILVSLLADLEQATPKDEELCKVVLESLAGLRLSQVHE